MMYFYIAILVLFSLTGCGGRSTSVPESVEESVESSLHHEDITSTVFWIGENASEENGGIANRASAWDDTWTVHYGGIDTPNARSGYYPEAFTPDENPFYVALPYNDFDENGEKKTDVAAYIPWVHQGEDTDNSSVCKNHWVKITKGDRTVYAQWEDVGPFGEDDEAYVFGTALPKNPLNFHAGIDVSPAVRDYLGLQDIDRVDWMFVEASDVPKGPWKEIVTTRNVSWEDEAFEWYHPDIETRWQWQLQGELNTVYDVDLYDIDLFDTDQETIEEIQASGRHVICYFSAGSYESWRPDANRFPQKVLGSELDGWEGERWLDIGSEALKEIMQSRLDLAVEKGCDGVEPDNVDGYTNDTGFALDAEMQLAYNRFLSGEAHSRGLSIGLKNDLDQVEVLEPFFDFAVNEQCHEYEECDFLYPFIRHGKPVLNAEYARKYHENTDGAADKLCEMVKEEHFHTLILPLMLDDSSRISCDKR